MTVLLIVLYIIVGAAASGAISYLWTSSPEFISADNDDLLYGPIMIGVFWPVAAPFAFALYFSKKIYYEKKGKWR